MNDDEVSRVVDMGETREAVSKVLRWTAGTLSLTPLLTNGRVTSTTHIKMWTLKTLLVIALVVAFPSFTSRADHAQNSNEYNADGTSGNTIDGGVSGRRSSSFSGPEGVGNRGTGVFGSQGTPGAKTGSFGPSGPRRVGLNIGGTDQDSIADLGSNTIFGQPIVGAGVLSGQPAGVGGAGVGFGQAGVGAGVFSGQPAGVGGAGVRFGQSAGVGGPGVVGGRGAGVFGSGQGAARVVQAPITPTVTKTVTIDHFVTLTDLAFHSVPVTLTDLVVRTTTLTTGQVIRTPVNDRIALQTTVVIRPTTLTVTCSKYYYNIVTDVSVDYVTITHTSYIINQLMYTTTATQLLEYTSTMVRTVVHTQRTTVTDYHTIANTVYDRGGNYYY